VVDEIIDGKLNPREFFKEHAGLRNDSQLRMLVDELAFMASSPGYYDLHAAIDCVEIRCAGVGLPKKVGVELRFRLAQDELSDVKQHGIEGKTYPVYLAGNDGKSGYIGKKIAEARKSLEAWLDFDSVDCHPVS